MGLFESSEKKSESSEKKSESSEKNQVYLSYSTPAEEPFKDQLVKDLKEEKIECATSESIPLLPSEAQKQWSQRKCKSAAAVLIVMSDDYQQDEECKADAEAAKILQSPMFFLKAKVFNENEWLKNIRGECASFDLTEKKYKNNVKRLIASLKQLMVTPGKFRGWGLGVSGAMGVLFYIGEIENLAFSQFCQKSRKFSKIFKTMKNL